MYKKALLAVIIVALLVAGALAYQRYHLESENQQVELILDLEQWQKLGLEEEKLSQTLTEYRELGVSSLAVKEESVEDLVERGKISLFSSLDINLLTQLSRSEEEVLSQLDTAKAQSYLLYEQPAAKERVLNNIATHLGEQRIVAVNEELQLIALDSSKGELLDLKLGFSAAELNLATELGFKIVPRLSNENNINPQIIEGKFASLDELAKEATSQLIFNGSEALGYPDQLKLTEELMGEYQLNLGMIESFITSQAGVKSLANSEKLATLRVHSADQEEFDKLTNFQLVARYLRAVRERGARSLYLRPVLESKEGLSALEASQNLIVDLVSSLEKNGYSIGVAQPGERYSSSRLSLLLINLGILAAFFYLIDYLEVGSFPGQPNQVIKVILFLLLSLSAALMIFGVGAVNLNRQLIALLAALVFPVLAVVAVLLADIFNPERQNKELGWRALIKLYLQVNFITLGGGILIAGALSDWRYFLHIRQFRGVKLALFAPLVIFLGYYLHYSFWLNNEQWSLPLIKERIKAYLNRCLRFKDLLLLIFIVFAVILYTVRSGNQPLIPVLDFEVAFRHWLEALLLIRPRFKAFLIGHPLLILAIYLLYQRKGQSGAYLLLGALVGQITIINTFSHLHTPFWVSGLRAVNGIVLGAVLGLVLIKVEKLAQRYFSYEQERSKEI
ncbi:DUF5693 family protein [Fuchsiella alkaliacetigena]|uniref:DUF5693 family protein n=1 Tax=Fuchsiella alkaliacetigena TaxID=957042 RepID=UPI00200AE1AD|nr:DUF5693 family protein [Fuchsiella alkaliacetigena]MCK8824092.1 DUF5693 family protein [Fuchsiella alkaliacetigena]